MKGPTLCKSNSLRLIQYSSKGVIRSCLFQKLSHPFKYTFYSEHNYFLKQLFLAIVFGRVSSIQTSYVNKMHVKKTLPIGINVSDRMRTLLK